MMPLHVIMIMIVFPGLQKLSHIKDNEIPVKHMNFADSSFFWLPSLITVSLLQLSQKPKFPFKMIVLSPSHLAPPLLLLSVTFRASNLANINVGRLLTRRRFWFQVRWSVLLISFARQSSFEVRPALYNAAPRSSLLRLAGRHQWKNPECKVIIYFGQFRGSGCHHCLERNRS